MKSYNEMAKNALKRIDEENKAIVKKRKILKRILIPTLSLCVAAVVGFGVMDGFEKMTEPEIEESYEYLYEGTVDTKGNTTGFETTAAVGNTAKPDNSNGGSPNVQSSAPQDSGETTEAPCIRIVSIMYEGKNYVYYESKDMTIYEKDKLLGGVSTFIGYYKPEYIDGKVYSVKNSSEFLIIELDGDQKILLKEVS